MFVYYGYLLPLSTRIRRGFYEDGIWTDSGFMPYTEVGGHQLRRANDTVVADRHLALKTWRGGCRARSSTTAQRGVSCATRSASTRSTSTGPGLDLGARDERDESV